MRFVLVVLVALGLTMTWQATVVAKNNQQQAALEKTSDNLPAELVEHSRRD